MSAADAAQDDLDARSSARRVDFNSSQVCQCGHPRFDHFRSTGQCAESGCGCFPYISRDRLAARDQLADLLAAGIKAQVNDDRFDAPWVDENCAPGFLRVDGEIELATLADVLIAAGWEKR